VAIKSKHYVDYMATILNQIFGRNTGKKSKKTVTTKRASKKTKKAKAATKKAKSIPNDNIDVRQPKDIQGLTDLLKNSKITVVLVYADWCGHCQTFKNDVWSKLSNLPNRKVPMAQINAEQLPSTPLSKANVDGYPTVLLVGNDMKPTNIENARDMNMMTKIVNADPENVLGDIPAEAAEPVADAAVPTEGNNNSLKPTEDAEEALNVSAKEIINSMGNIKNNSNLAKLEHSPPEMEEGVSGPMPMAGGGPLYRALKRFVRTRRSRRSRYRK